MGSAYVTESEADTYFSERLNTEAWDDATSIDRIKALKMATRAIDRLNYVGIRNDENQELQFPRYDDSSVPQDVLDACCEEALSLLDGVDPSLEFDNLNMVSQGYSNVKSTFDRRVKPEHIIAGITSIFAWRLLRPFLRDYFNVELRRGS